MMKNCPRCNAPNDDVAVSCKYCGITFPAAPVQSQPNMNPQTVHIHNNYYRSGSRNDYAPAQPVQSGPFDKWKTWQKILVWLFCFPLMITLIALKKKKRLWTVAAILSWIVYFIWIALSNSPANEAKRAAERTETAKAYAANATATESVRETERAERTAVAAMTEAVESITETVRAYTNTPAPTRTVGCREEYIGVCLWSDRDYTCSDIPEKNFSCPGSDPLKLDRNNDGVCCEH